MLTSDLVAWPITHHLSGGAAIFNKTFSNAISEYGQSNEKG
jgi:hypothetical protein